MEHSLSWLLASALIIGLTHTALGPDHYLPFIVLGRAEGWPLRKTLRWTAICGLGHVLSSVVVGALGIGLGWALGAMESFEGVRGELAGLALMTFGLLYLAWGLWRGRRGHVHPHVHQDGTMHAHRHGHASEAPGPQHQHAPHDQPDHVAAHRRTVWAMFVVFVLGPCEPLIPLLMVPATGHSLAGVALVTLVFGLATVGTMLTVVTLGYYGARLVNFRGMERWAHAMAGAAILVSGLLISVFGL